jgi:hypothetical protein
MGENKSDEGKKEEIHFLGKPPDFVFKNPGSNASRQVTNHKMLIPITERVGYEYNGRKGIFRWTRGYNYPEEGQPYPDMMVNLNTVKKNAKSYWNILSSKYIQIGCIGFIFIPFKWKIRAIEHVLTEFVETNEYILFSDFLEQDYYCPPAYETMHLVANFLSNLGINRLLSERFGEICGMFLQGDNAYRYRALDMFGETDLARLLARPAEEICRIARLAYERDADKGTGEKFTKIARLLRLALLHPKIKRAFKKALSDSEITNLQPSDGDKEQFYNLDGRYNFEGKTIEERSKLFLKTHDGLPPMWEIEGF